MPVVNLPNGTALNFPDDMSQDAMRDAIQRNFPEYAPKANGASDSGAFNDAAPTTPIKSSTAFGRMDDLGNVVDDPDYKPSYVNGSVMSTFDGKIDPQTQAKIDKNNALYDASKVGMAQALQNQRARDLNAQTDSAAPLSKIDEQRPELGFGSTAKGLTTAVDMGVARMAAGFVRMYAEQTGNDALAEKAAGVAEKARNVAAANTPRFKTPGQSDAYSEAESFAKAVPGLAATAINPALGAAVFGADAAGNSYAELRAQGIDPTTATISAAAQGGIMAAMTKIPLGYVADKFGQTGVTQFAAGLIARDVPSMYAQNMASSFVNNEAAGTTRSVSDWINDQPKEFRAAALSALVFSVGTTTAHAAATVGKQAFGRFVDPKGQAASDFSEALNDNVKNFNPDQFGEPYTVDAQARNRLNPNAYDSNLVDPKNTANVVPTVRPPTEFRDQSAPAEIADLRVPTTFSDLPSTKTPSALGTSTADKLLAIRPLDQVKKTIEAAPDVDTAIAEAQRMVSETSPLESGFTREQQQRTQDIQTLRDSDALEQHLSTVHPEQADLVRSALSDSLDSTIEPTIRAANNDELHSYLTREGVFDRRVANQDATVIAARDARAQAALREAEAHPDVVGLNRALAAPRFDPMSGDRIVDKNPTQVRLVDAPTDQHAIAQELGEAFGTATFIVSANPTFNGVAHDGKVFISASEQHPAIAIMGHELVHNRPEVADKLREFVTSYLRDGVVEQKQAAEIASGGDPSRTNALDETLADVNGAIWLQPEFWGQMRQKDPQLFRQAAYTFMEVATRAIEIVKGSKFEASRLVTDVDKVRDIISDTWAGHFKSKDEGKASDGLLDRLAASRATEDTGKDIPLSLFKKVKVEHDVWIEDEGRAETMKVSAKDALASLKEDIQSHESLLDCLRG